jgi:RHS repeat-associated protein
VSRSLPDSHARRVVIEEDGEQRVQVYGQGGQYLFEEPDLISDASFTVGESKQGKPSTRYQYLGNMLIAKSSGTQTTFVHTDHLGSPIAESTAAPVQVTHLPLHEPYGAPSNGTYLDGPGYTGHVVDGLTGLSYMQARYYDPVAGRFLGVDPVHVDLASGANFNRYIYANNNPYLYVDPDGEFVDTFFDAADVLINTGQILGGAAAYAVGAATGNDTMMNVAADGIAEGRQDMMLAGAALVTPGVNTASMKAAAVAIDKAESLVEKADQIRKAGNHPASRNQRTIAVGEDSNGKLHAASSNGFDRGQRAEAESLGINCVSCSKGAHAEENLLREVPDLQRVGTSKRSPCGASEHNCRGQLEAKGVKIDND